MTMKNMKHISKLFVLFAIGMMATACSDDIPGGEVNNPLTVSTPEVAAVRATSAVVSATATGSHITSRGFCYSTTPDPTIDNIKMSVGKKDMQITLSSLSKGTTYYLRAYAQTMNDVKYSDEVLYIELLLPFVLLFCYFYI